MKKNIFTYLTAIFACISIFTSLFCVFLVMQEGKRTQQNQEQIKDAVSSNIDMQGTIYQEEELRQMIDVAMNSKVSEMKFKIKSDVEEEGVITMLRNLFPENLVIADRGEYVFIPLSETLKKHSYDQEQIIQTEDGLMEYYIGEEKVSHKGIDISKFQGDINWNLVAEDNVEFVFMRVGLRGYGTGEIVLDQNYESYIKGATEALIDVGLYFFTAAITEEEAIEEAEFVLDQIKGYDIACPIVIDVEDVLSDSARMNDLTATERTDIVIAFCERIKAAGYEPMIYGNMKTFLIMLEMERLEEYKKWFAYYNAPIYFPYQFDIWQYTEKGSVNGISTDVDLNISFGNYK